MKKFVVIGSLFFSMCLNTSSSYAEMVTEQVDASGVQAIDATLASQTREEIFVDETVLDPIYAGDTQITGVMSTYGISNIDGRKVYVRTDDNSFGAARFIYNGKQFPNASYDSAQLFNHQITRINEDQLRFVFTVPDYIVLRAGDTFKHFYIHSGGILPSELDVNQINWKMSAEVTVLPAESKPVGTASVQVRYVDDEGNQLREPKQITGTVGTAYDVSVAEYLLTIPGYTLNVAKLPANRTGIFTNQAQTVIYVYEKDSVEEDLEEEPINEDPTREDSTEESVQESTTSESNPADTTSGAKDQSSTSSSSKGNSSSEDQASRTMDNTQGDTTGTTNSSNGKEDGEKQLPQAGAKQNLLLGLMGSVFLLSSFVLLFNRRKKLQ
jgi:LPXTG-motif cell wall-anchored protein